MKIQNWLTALMQERGINSKTLPERIEEVRRLQYKEYNQKVDKVVHTYPDFITKYKHRLE
ncbi:hypothetical protein [Paenibacillus periandrae]|uniref:hypothetical protein n=1 Tax=Paenibacillus periandrae TaxID=1761741 RepID=UPI001F0966E4|nr:hypothetical protein [Paenibacillus periandrae]